VRFVFVGGVVSFGPGCGVSVGMWVCLLGLVFGVLLVGVVWVVEVVEHCCFLLLVVCFWWGFCAFDSVSFVL